MTTAEVLVGMLVGVPIGLIVYAIGFIIWDRIDSASYDPFRSSRLSAEYDRGYRETQVRLREETERAVKGATEPQM